MSATEQIQLLSLSTRQPSSGFGRNITIPVSGRQWVAQSA